MRLAEVTVQCVGERSGYGQVAAGLRAALAKRGVADVEHAGLVLQVNPAYCYAGKRQGQEVWLFSMWESTRIPEIVVEKIDNFAGVIVPTEYNRAQFAEFHDNVHVARLGVDPAVWYPLDRTVGDRWRVLVIAPKPGGNEVRKGLPEAKAAFARAFPDADCLHPRPELTVLFTHGRYSDDELRQVYADHHCYLALSKGEGWHMLPFQAVATGMPAVVTDNPGHMEWAAEMAGCSIVSTSFAPSAIGGVGKEWSGFWWEPDVDHAAALLRACYDSYSVQLQQAAVGAASIAAAMTWDDTADAVLAAVGDSARPRPDVDVVVPPACRTFPVMPLRSGTADIGPSRYRFTKGTVLEVTADAKRVLLTSGAVTSV